MAFDLKFRRWCCIGLALLIAFSCRKHSENTHAAPKALSVAAASNVQYALEELIQEFEAETGVQVNMIVSSSGKLAAQISQGAPYDVFVSADEKYPAALADSGLTADTPRVYGYGRLVLWTVRENLDLSAGLEVLKDKSIRKIAIANPDLAPYGDQSMRILEFLGLAAQLRSKLVFGENISQTSQYIESGACDLGFTAKAVVLAAQLSGKGKWVEVPEKFYSPIAQSAVITRVGADGSPVESRQFFAFLFSEKAKEILRRYGYGVPAGE